MHNLIKRCENCVYSGSVPTDYLHIFLCNAPVPIWVELAPLDEPKRIVINNYATNCDLFRLRETGVNE